MFKAVENAVDAADVRPLAASGESPSVRGGGGGAHAVSLDGQWRRMATADDCSARGFDDSRWPTVTVPNCYGVEPGLSRYFGPVWYRRRIAVPHPRGGDWLDLEFSAADYFCEVYLDGEFLGRHEGYFAPFSFDVSGRARPGSVLAVKVECPLEDLEPSSYLLDHRKRQIRGVLNYHDSRPGGMPGASTPGWTAELGQSLPSGGITGGVKVRATGPVRVDAVFASSTERKLNLAVFAINRVDEIIEIELDVEVSGPQRHTGQARASLVPGANRIDLASELPDAALWIPDETAAGSAMYEITATVRAFDAESDSRSVGFGFRTFDLDSTSPESWRFRLNQKPVAIRGANYIPTQHFAGIGSDWYSRDIALVSDLGLNGVTVRAHQQPASFYDAADHAGLLVFQDFSLQWNYESDESLNRGFRDRASRMAAEMAYTLWNHPSVVYWCCHNEPPYVWGHNAEVDDRGDRDNQALDRIVRDRLVSVDPTRPVVQASGASDVHKYEGSLAGGALGDFSGHPSGFVSEFGFPAPGWASSSWGDAGWPPDAITLKEWASRLSCLGTASTYVGAPDRYACPQDWIYACQRYGAHLLKYQVETMRTWPGSNFMVHMLNDWWGYAGMGLTDCERQPKLGYWWLKDALRPLISLITHPRSVFSPGEQVSLPVWVASDRDHDTNALVVSWRLCRVRETEIITSDPAAAVLGATGLRAPEGHRIALGRNEEAVAELESGRFYAPVRARSSVLAGELSFTTPSEAPCGYTVFLDWENPLGERGRNSFHFAVLADITPPGLWPAPRFNLDVSAGEPGRRTKVRIVREYRAGEGHIDSYTGEGGVAHFSGLPPDCYEVTSPSTGSSALLELWRDTSINLA